MPGKGRPFQKGVSGNPGGRPRQDPEVRALCEKYGIPYVQESVWTRARKMVDVVVGKSSMRRLASLGRSQGGAEEPLPDVA